MKNLSKYITESSKTKVSFSMIDDINKVGEFLTPGCTAAKDPVVIIGKPITVGDKDANSKWKNILQMARQFGTVNNSSPSFDKTLEYIEAEFDIEIVNGMNVCIIMYGEEQTMDCAIFGGDYKCSIYVI